MYITYGEAVNILRLEGGQAAILPFIENGSLIPYLLENSKKRLLLEEVIKFRGTNISFFNQKGGVGKTTSAILAADYFHKKGYKVLLVDLDPQASLSLTYIEPEVLIASKGVYDYLDSDMYNPLHNYILPIKENLDLMPSNISLNKLDHVDTTSLMYKKSWFMKFFSEYEITIIDCPPTLNSLSRFGMLLSHYILTPITLDPFCLYAIKDVIKNIKMIKVYNADFIENYYFVNSAVKKNIKIYESVKDKYIETLTKRLLKNSIPDFIGITERVSAPDSIYTLYAETHPKIKNIDEFFDDVKQKIFEEI